MMAMGVFANFCETGDDDFDVVGVVDIFEVETFAFSGGLDVDITKSEKCREEAFRFAGDVLDLVEIDFGDDAVKESILFGVDDAFARHDPDVQPIIGKFGESEDEYHEKVREECEHEDRTPENVLENRRISESDD